MLGGELGRETLGFDRWVGQEFYRSRDWKDVREFVILRDNGCDLGAEGCEIHSSVLVHHMNPLHSDDIVHSEDWVLDPEYLVTTTQDTHNAIHRGIKPRRRTPVLRGPGDTKLW